MRRLLLFTFLIVGYLANASNINDFKNITGKVLDENKSPLPFASVSIEGTTKGTTTDLEGNFSLDAETGDILVISFVGYEDFKVTVDDRTNYEIVLGEGIDLGEVIVVGSRGKPRTALETAVAVDVIGAKAIESSPQAELGQVMQHAAPSFHSTKRWS